MTKLANGTTSSTLSPQILSALSKFVEACSKSGVKRAQIGEITIDWGENLTLEEISLNNSPRVVPSSSSKDMELPYEDRLELLSITDPAAYEEALTRNE